MSSSISKQDFVVSNPEILSGIPVFAGTRVPIDTVLACLDSGDDLKLIRESYPIADEEHIAAARAYRAAHPRGRPISLIERHPDLVLVSRCVVRKVP